MDLSGWKNIVQDKLLLLEDDVSLSRTSFEDLFCVGVCKLVLEC